MSIKTNYFDGHTYSAADDRRPWYSLMDDGVFGIATQALKVVASSPADLSVNVQPGACIVAGYYIYSDAVVNLPIIANTSGYNRVDIVVVEVDEVNKETDIRIVQGTPTSTPTAPLPNEQQYVLAEIFVGNNVSVIENSNITDRREEAMTKTLKTHQAEDVTQADVVQTTEVNDSTKVPSSAVTYALQQLINSRYQIITGDVLAWALTCDKGITSFYATQPVSNLPNANPTFTLGFVLKTAERLSHIFIADRQNGKVYKNTYNPSSQAWLGWQEINMTAV